MNSRSVWVIAKWLNPKTVKKSGTVAHVFNPSTQMAEAGDLCEFEASLVYVVIYRTARATQ